MIELDYFIYIFGAIFFFSAVAFAFYALKSAKLMRGQTGHKVMAAGSILFIVTSVIFAAERYFFPGTILSYAGFFAWVAALSMIVSGGLLRANEIRKVHKFSWFKIALVMPHGKFYLFATVVLTFVGFPIFVLDVLFTPSGSPSWFSVASVSIWAVSFTSLAIAERMFNHSTQPSAVIDWKVYGGLLRDDIQTFKAYADLTSRFSSTVARVTGVGLIKEALEHCCEEHEILGGCEFDEKGVLKIDKVITNMSLIDKKESIKLICVAFSSLNCRLISLYGAATSPDIAKVTFENIYQSVKNSYGQLTNFSEIARGLPNGILEGERLAFARREELERMVRDRTTELNKAINELERADYERTQSESRFKTLVGLLPEPVFETDKSGKIVFLNLAGYQTLGYSVKEIGEGLDILQLFVKSDRERARKNIDRALNGEKLNGDEYFVVKRDGKKIPVHMRVAPIIYADKPTGIRGIFIDITGQKQVEDFHRKSTIDILMRLRRAEKFEKIEQASEKIKKIQMDAIDTIKKEINVGRRPSYLVETYKDLLGRPLIDERALRRKRPPRNKKKLK